jgi:hypothetical protein
MARLWSRNSPKWVNGSVLLTSLSSARAGETSSRAEWHDAAAYAPLLEADHSLFAWEWLRRDPAWHSALISGTILRQGLA